MFNETLKCPFLISVIAHRKDYFDVTEAATET